MATRVVKYNPAFLTDTELVESFAVRHSDLELLVSIIRENTSAANRHVLVIGPRGSGKTTLVRRVATEVSRDQELREKWFPVIFAEESYQVTTPGEFWLEAAFHLAHQMKDSAWLRTYEEVGAKWQDEDLMRERALGLLMDFAAQQRKRLLLIVENLNMLLGDQISDDDAWKVRHTLQNEPRVMLLATATSRFEEIEHPGKAMYEIFQPHELRPLDRKQCQQFWGSRTGEQLDDQRIRPIQILTGGNIRLLTILASFGARVSLRRLMGDLTQLVDEHTEYFKSHLDALPAVERKVYLALAELWDPSTARDVAKAARLDVNKTSSLLRRLVKRGAVKMLDEPGRTKWYELSERMYNIYYLLRRRGGPSQRVRAVVRFIIQFYEPDQMVSTAERIAAEVAELATEERQDHLQAFYELMNQAPADNVRNKLLEVARNRFRDVSDLPAPLARAIEVEKAKPTRLETTEVGAGEDGSAESLFAQALLLLDEPDQFHEAESLCRKAIEIQPDYELAWALLGRLLHEELSRFDEAEQAYRKAIEIQSVDSWAWAQLGQLLHEKLSRFEEAEQAYRKAIEIKPAYEWAWAKLGQLLHEKLSRFDEAEQAYRRAIEIKPDYEWAWAKLGQLLHEKLSRFEEAEQAYRKAIEIKPDDEWNWAQLGWLLHEKSSRFDEAEQAYRKAIEIQPEYDWAWSQLGRLLHEELSRFEEAEQAYRKVIEIDPDYAWAWGQLGFLFHDHLSRFDEAEQAYRKAIDIEPVPFGWAKLGQLLHERFSRFEEAEQAYRNALEIQPDYEWPQFQLMEMLLQLERTPDALQFAEETVAQSDGDAEVLNNLAWTLYESGPPSLPQQALDWASTAVKRSPDRGDYQHTLSSIQCAMGQLDDALGSAKEFLKDVEDVRDSLDDAISLFVELAARGRATEALTILTESPSADQLEPLIVGLRMFAGKDVEVAVELKEIGSDVRQRVEDRKSQLLTHAATQLESSE